MILDFNITSLEQKIVWVFLIIEIVVVTVLVVGSYIFKVFFMINSSYEKKKLLKIKHYFEKKDIGKPPPYLRDLDLIYSELNQSHSMSDDEKRHFVKQHLIKRTRPFIHSKRFIKRYYLLESYNYYITIEDKDSLIELIKDKRDTISIYATRLSNVLVDASIYQAIITKLTELDWGNQKLYLSQLLKNEVLLQVIENILADATPKRIRRICYDIAYHCRLSSQKLFEFALVDIDKYEGNYRMAAIRVLGLSNPELAKNKLFNLLHNNDWLTRNSAVRSLAQIDLPASMKQLSQCLNDENYWVRVNATKELLSLGEEGRLFLSEYLASNEARFQPLISYFMDIQEIKDQL